MRRDSEGCFKMKICCFSVVALLLIFPVMAAAEPYSLNDCLEMAMERNPDLSQARKLAAEAALRVTQAESRRFPELNLSARAGYVSELSQMEFESSTIQVMPDMPPITMPGRKMEVGEHESCDLSLNLTQPIYMGGRIKNAIDYMQMAASSVGYRVDATEEQLRYDVVFAFYQLAKTMEIKEIANALLELTDTHLNDAGNLLEQGMLLKSDLLPIKLRRLEAELNIVKAENAVARSEALLAERIGLDGNEKPEIEIDWNKEPPWPIPNEIEQSDTLRPEQKILHQGIELADKEAKISRGGLKPEVRLSLVEHFGWPGFVNDDPEWTPWWQAGINVSWNVFDKGRRRLEYKEALVRRERAADASRALDRKISLDRTNTRLNYEESYRKLQIAREKVTTAEENYRIFRDSFKEGVASNTDYLDAQTELTNSRNEQAVIAAELRIAWADYLRALGISEWFETNGGE